MSNEELEKLRRDNAALLDALRPFALEGRDCHGDVGHVELFIDCEYLRKALEAYNLAGGEL